MCGIVGLFLTSGTCQGAAIVTMRDTLTHRGPDDAGTFLQGPLGLGHRRLSIIDLGGGHQPMTTADGRLVIVFNGEIYNYRELRKGLESKGHHFRTESDTEVILAMHQQLGDAAVAHLNGMFAYALWDNEARRLVLVRDRAGIKPLYYTATTQGLAFASEAKALFQSGLLTPRLHPDRIAEYLTFRHVSSDEGLFAGVRQLPPGCLLSVSDGRQDCLERYWNPVDLGESFIGSFNDAVDALDATLQDSVARQLVSDVPVGTFCSGGIDSSVVTAIAARRASGRINTYSVGFDEAAFDESHYARLASRACGTAHHELRVSEAEFADLLPKVVWHHDFPLNFPNSVHIFALSLLAKQNVTVVLTGEGADELFGGYPRYYLARLSRAARSLPQSLRKKLGVLLAEASDGRLRRLGSFLTREPAEWLLINNATTDIAIAESLTAISDSTFLTRASMLREVLDVATDEVTALAIHDFRTYLCSILDRQDKMSMAASIEARVPFLDNELIDFARSLPLSFRQTIRHRKRVLKHVALRHLPADIVHRRKSGFGVPLATWFAGSGPMSRLMQESIAGDLLADVLDTGALRRLAERHRLGDGDHSEALWSALNLHLWRLAYGV